MLLDRRTPIVWIWLSDTLLRWRSGVDCELGGIEGFGILTRHALAMLSYWLQRPIPRRSPFRHCSTQSRVVALSELSAKVDSCGVSDAFLHPGQLFVTTSEV